MADVRSFPRVPLVGQPLEILGWQLVLFVQCKVCQPAQLVPLTVKQSPLGRTTDRGICPGCASAMHITQMGMNAENQLEFGVEYTPQSVPTGTVS